LQALRDAFGPGTADRALNDVAGLLKDVAGEATSWGGWAKRSLRFLEWMQSRQARK
jgi:hypothetical protein